jgi:hypothetical protein
MGSDNNNNTMTASAPAEEGKKCLWKVTFDRKSRMVEWHTSWGTFKDMDTKVRHMFGLSDKLKLVYSYQENTTFADIIMVRFSLPILPLPLPSSLYIHFPSFPSSF